MSIIYIVNSNDSTIIKLGITTRHPKYRLNEHRTSFKPYRYFSLISIKGSINDQLDNLLILEKYILSKTHMFRITDDYDSLDNECRRGIDPKDVFNHMVRYLDFNNIPYDIIPLNLLECINKRQSDNLNDYCEFIMLDEPINIRYFLSESDIKNHAIAIDTTITQFKLRDYQSDVIQLILTHFNHNDKCIINWACGLGKTITSLYILYEWIKIHHCKTILIGVPSVAILTQWLYVINSTKYFDNYKNF